VRVMDGWDILSRYDCGSGGAVLMHNKLAFLNKLHIFYLLHITET